ncbi:FecR family protein [Sphingobacterium sp. SGG-5]|uniref:FecR family protein n=1 Tax=Sphingobacterium sp. SGG-5 TaxID=2710881 RepID=UPI0013EB91F6|nr:FecR domain-containing protein [Sphingobacterium sp. SGG-5]NGM62133.1 FecR family protein [Sphingobacterium sp. SGG-5]
MENKTDIRTLAIQYFEGQIAKQDEKVLFDYIDQSPHHNALFRQWEKEWKRTNKSSRDTDQAWAMLQNKIRTQEAIRPLLAKRKKSSWKKIAAVAAILTVLFGVSLLLWKYRSLPAEKYIVFEAPYGGKSKIILSDSTVVWLNAGSVLTYSDHFDVSDRRVKLDGEGYFEVTKQPENKLFTVETRGYNVVVRGTKFNVSAYPDDSFITTTLIEGAVDLDYQNQLIRMTPGESTKLDWVTQKINTVKVDPGPSNAWVEDRLEFDNMTLEEIVKKLSRQYNVNIHLSSQKVKATRFRISLRNKETIDEVLFALKEVVPISIERRDKDVYITE